MTALLCRWAAVCQLLARASADPSVPAALLESRRDYFTRDYFTNEAHAHVAILAVAREAEGQGIGRALLQAGQDWARANRYSKLTLAVFKENERAKQVYEHQGWRSELETGTNHWFDRRGAQGRPNRWLASRDLLA